MIVACDFHNHSCLSPCGSLDLSPAVLAHVAAQKGLELVALTDHNSSLNTPAFAECAKREGIFALYGMEATTAEEVHVLCLFAEVKAALDFSSFIEGHIPFFPYDPEKMGDQAVVDENDEIVELYETYLGIALDMDYGTLCDEAFSRNALVIPAHIDRPMFGAIAQLGFLPDGPYAAVETMRPLLNNENRAYSVITGSDAHYPENIARRPFGLELPDSWNNGTIVNIEAIKNALLSNKIELAFR